MIAQDRPGLLYQISSALAEAGYNIEVALIDTEGVKAIDVFYLTSLNKKLTSAQEAELRETLAHHLDWRAFSFVISAWPGWRATSSRRCTRASESF